ncbi:MAG TPA: DUF1566 domain-containing protein [Dehalococcoidia bacterium]|nr:DUF1566 domain-containing protein [Dehalococcoidia bacterium]
MLTSITNRVNTLLLVLLVLMAAAIIAILANRAIAGPLDPPGPPASTMHTLDQVYGSVQNVPPSWDQKLNASNGAAGPNPPAGCNSDRFTCVMTSTLCTPTCVTQAPAVLDRETGLVWERVPSSSVVDWLTAIRSCYRADTGKRQGWRLPTQAELESLRDDGVSPPPALPIGNPFGGPLTGTFWSSTQDLQTPGLAYTASFQVNGDGRDMTDGSVIHNYWCVRGPTSKE